MMRVFLAPALARRSLMAHFTTPRLRSPIHRLGTQPAPQPELGLDDLLSAATLEQILQDEGATWKEVLYTPFLTFWTFFWQVLSPDRSRRAALKRLGAWMGCRGQTLPNEDTGPYCKARIRLPESALHRLMRALGLKTHQEAPTEWRWCGRKVKLVDGSTAIMPDTPANQQ